MASNIGMVIKRARESKKMSQNQLAKKSGVSQSAISSIESTTKSPSLDTISDIAAALGITVVELLETNEKEPTAQGDGLDEALVNLLVDLSPAEAQRVKDFVSGLIAARTGGASRQE